MSERNWRYWIPSANQSCGDATEMLSSHPWTIERAAEAGAQDFLEQHPDAFDSAEFLRADVPIDPPLLVTVQKASASGWLRPVVVGVRITPRSPEFQAVHANRPGGL